jgi:RimJ/RimL family protein N-acetyltransferase
MRVLTTERLVLRPFQREDGAFLVRLLNEPSFIANIEDKGVRTRAQAILYIARTLQASYRDHGHGMYRVALRDTLQPIGACGLVQRDPDPELDLGYAFLPAFWGQGYALEAARAVVEVARTDLGRRELFALVTPDNGRSIALLGRLGFAFAQNLPRVPGPGLIALYALRLVRPAGAPLTPPAAGAGSG